MSYDAAGAIGHAPEKGLIAYFGVTDVDAAVARVRDLGGEAAEVQEIPGIGRYAKCADRHGNQFGLYEDGRG